MTAGAASLDADELWREAGADAAWPGEAAATVVVALSRLVAAIEAEARLTPSGLLAARTAITRALTNQIQLRQLQRSVPSVADQDLGQPVFITGLHRTGTTFLQSLLAAHPGFHAPRLWELLAPAQQASEQTLVAVAARYVDEYYRAAPAFADIHPLDAREPEECHRLTGNSFLSEIYGLRYYVPGYLDWLAGQDHVPAYRLHRDQLRAILWRRPARGQQLVLKCPFHLWHAAELATVYPQARIIRMHRDPLATIASSCSLTHVIRQARAGQVDPGEIGSFWLSRTKFAVSELLRNGAEAFAGLEVMDVRYRDLVADPVAVVERVCDFAGVPLHASARQRVRGRATVNRVRRGGPHRYRLTDFELDPMRLSQIFADYQAAFDL